MEEALLTVEEAVLTVEEDVEKKPAPRRRPSRSRAATADKAPAEQPEAEVVATAVLPPPDDDSMVATPALPEMVTSTDVVGERSVPDPENPPTMQEVTREPALPTESSTPEGDVTPVQLVADVEAPS